MWAVIILLLLVLIYIWGGTSQHPDSLKINTGFSVYEFDSGVPGPIVCFLAGVHGNEYAGTVALEQLIKEGYFRKITRGRVRIIPRANPWGLQHNVRYQFNAAYPDLNRNFSENGMETMAQNIVGLLRDVDLVVDFHEGWGWHQISPESVGSTVSPTHIPPAPQIAQVLCTKLNQNILGKKQFVLLDDISCDIAGTLSCYMQKNKKAYILVETTGQNDIQPLSLRVSQVVTVVTNVLGVLGASSPLNYGMSNTTFEGNQLAVHVD